MERADDGEDTVADSALVPHDACVHPVLNVTRPRVEDGAAGIMRIACGACGKTVEFPLETLGRSAEDQSQVLRMTFGEAWVKRMGGV